MTTAHDILRQAPVVPVLTIRDLKQAVPLAQALVDGGVPVLEVTLRTDAGLPSIRAIAEAVPNALVGAGTVLNGEDFAQAVAAGSRFIVTPGLTTSILEAAKGSPVPLIPGVATISELMRARDEGLSCLKFFPAEASGGAAALRAFAGPVSDVHFCPTGGIDLNNLEQYLRLPSVLTVGGSWLTPQDAVDSGDWDRIRSLAREACARVKQIREPAGDTP